MVDEYESDEARRADAERFVVALGESRHEAEAREAAPKTWRATAMVRLQFRMDGEFTGSEAEAYEFFDELLRARLRTLAAGADDDSEVELEDAE